MIEKSILFRKPKSEDGGKVFAFIKACGSLDLNSPYCYLLQCAHFSATSIVAEQDGQIVGFASGYRPPIQPDALFIWQIGVSPLCRGQGVGKALARKILARPENTDIAYLEASITPSNDRSRSLFTSLAKEYGAPYQERLFFGANHFAPVEHEEEMLIRIGPIKHST